MASPYSIAKHTLLPLLYTIKLPHTYSNPNNTQPTSSKNQPPPHSSSCPPKHHPNNYSPTSTTYSNSSTANSPTPSPMAQQSTKIDP